MADRNRRGVFLAAVGVFVVLIIGALAVFQPWKLFVDTTVEEALPAGATEARPSGSAPASTERRDPPTTSAGSVTSTTAAASVTSTSSAPVATSGGPFQSYEHETTGTVRVVQADGKSFLRLEDFTTSNGPDVVVYLSAAPASGPEHLFGTEPVNLGSLKGNKGNQNYEIPAGTDLTKYKTVVIWCKRFNVAFGAAPL